LRTVNVRRSRPAKVGRVRVHECLDCLHRWTTVEMSAKFIVERLLRDDHEALRDLMRVVC
jgi:transcriptional regulator NrdR family protein